MRKTLIFLGLLFSPVAYPHGLVGGTKVLTEFGLLAIEDIRKGDRIVTKNLVSGKDELVKARTRSVALVTDAVAVFFQGTCLQVSLSQEMHTNFGWLNAHSISARHSVVTASNPQANVLGVAYLGRLPVYSFRLVRNHAYYAGGILVSTTVSRNPDKRID